jgi:hypothetical protein
MAALRGGLFLSGAELAGPTPSFRSMLDPRAAENSLTQAENA